MKSIFKCLMVKYLFHMIKIVNKTFTNPIIFIIVLKHYNKTKHAKKRYKNSKS